jgi:transcriptional regulator with XRE-family HTH domain
MTKLYLKEVGLNLKQARKKIGMRQIEVEEKTGVSYRHYQNIEAGRVNVTLETLCRLACAFGTSVAELTKGRC